MFKDYCVKLTNNEVVCVKAASASDAILLAEMNHDQRSVRVFVPNNEERKLYGIDQPMRSAA